jgi:hypothetical protein
MRVWGLPRALDIYSRVWDDGCATKPEAKTAVSDEFYFVQLSEAR